MNDSQQSIEEQSNQVFESQEQCSEITGIPLSVLKHNKKIKTPGFRGHRIYWDEAKPYLLQQKEFIDSEKTKSYSELKSESVKLHNDKTRLEIKKLKQDYLDPKDVHTFLLTLGLTHEAVILGWIEQLPPKLVGKTQTEMEYIIKDEATKYLQTYRSTIREKIDVQRKR